MQTDDTTILTLLRQPNSVERGFRLLMKQYGECIYWHIRRIVVGHDDAEDTLQETTVNIFRHIGKFRGEPHQLKAWIYRIATNQAMMQLRSRKHFYQSIDDLAPTLLDTLIAENPVDMTEAEFILQKKLLALPTQQRLAFNMRYYDDLSYEDIAKITGKNVNTLKTNYHLARLKIEEELKQLSL